MRETAGREKETKRHRHTNIKCMSMTDIDTGKDEGKEERGRERESERNREAD